MAKELFDKGIRIEINGEIQKEKDVEFTSKEKEQFLDDFIEWIESKDLVFIGVTK